MQNGGMPMNPGHKLVEVGAENCSDAEILAILLGTGVKGCSAVDTANAVLERYGTLAGLMDKSLGELVKIHGLGPVKAIRIAAVFEFTRRILRHLEHNG